MKNYLVTFLFILCTAVPVFSAEPGIMDKDELKAMLGSEDLIVIDVRTGRDWSSSEFKIKGAVREDPEQVGSWSGSYATDRTIVLYCA